MKNISLIIILISMGLIHSCNGQNKNPGSKVNAPKQSPKMTILPIMAENNSIVAAACMLPENWQGEGIIEYDNSLGITPMVRMRAQNPNKKMALTSQSYTWYSYSSGHEMLKQQLGGNMPRYARPFEGIERYTDTNLMPMVDPSYQPTDRKPMNDFFVRQSPGMTNLALLTAFVNKNDQNRIAFLFTVVTVVEQQNGTQSWMPSTTFIEGMMEQGNEMYEIAKLICNTFQYNPIFSNAITQINLQMNENMKRNFQIQQKSIRSVNDAFYNTLHSIQQQSNTVRNETSEQFSDMMLGVETYRIPDTGEEVKMPSENDFYYTNGIGDFIGSNNPLFDPNVGYSSYYNWEKLQKKY